MTDQYGRNMRELSTPQQPVPPLPFPLQFQTLRSKSLKLITNRHKFLNERSYDPKSFHIWIKIGITKAREAYKNTADADRTDAMKVNCRVFECLDAATEKDLDKIKELELK
ncbi:hypothetical protein ACEPPN_007146 [Leptodophora sp. 'Broadleaf-Isolate-01']